MTHNEAKAWMEKLAKYPKLETKLVRILPEEIDPIQEGDNGWDVKITNWDSEITVFDRWRKTND